MNQATLVKDLRSRPIVGQCIDLVPYTDAYCDDVVRLRSLPNVRYFMNLVAAPSVEAQRAWHAGYRERFDDVLWMIVDKSGRVCGCNRIYDIRPHVLEKGSTIVDPELAKTAPCALEAHLLVFGLAFEVMKVNRVIARVRVDNTHMQSINSRFGFAKIGDDEIRGVPYEVFELIPSRFRPEPFQAIVDHWSRRHER